ncbi:hypothetical protein EI94DRAFT_98742 [Lactarius quietus]|nr:hypothetical protein EI94DRAFT_98742 [Lactarius quietus]
MADIDDPSLPQSEIDGFQIRVENSVSPELRYACLYWASHLIKIKDTDNEKVWPHLQKFLTRCLLWWIETMALLDTLREAAESVNRVRTWMASKVGDRFRLLASLMNDASRFLSYHADTISFNPLHVYHSALPFTPTETQLRKVYAHELKTSVKAPHGVEQGWDPTVMVKRCEVPICGVSLSPNGQFITAIGSKTIEIRDTLIGSSVVSIDLPKPLFYISVSSCIDGVDVGYRLKELVQVPAMPIEGPEVESRVVEALKHAEDIADLTPVSGLKNVLRSLLALIHAGYNYEQDRFMHLRKLQRRVEVFTKVVLMQIKGKELSDIPRRVLSDMEEFTREIEALTTTCRHMLSQGRLDRFAAGVENMRLHLIWEVSIWYRCISDAIEQFMKRDAIQQLESVVDVKRGIEAIYPENGKNSFNVSTNLRRAECLDGTRTVVLGKIFAWLKDPSGARTFWLSGIAGSGKSAIAQSASIRAALLPDHIVVSIFFSQFGYARLCDPSSVFQTLAFQLSLLDIGYKERLSEVFNEHPDILEKDLQCQYEKLIIEALGAIRRSHKYIIITLDGLDECEPYGVTAVLKVLLAEDIDHPRELKILTSSRPEAHLRSIFDAHTDIRKLSLEDVETESDILHYLRTSFKQHQTHLIDSLTVSEETISELAKRAGDSFIYATTIVRFIFDEPSRDPQMRADFLLRNTADPERRPHARLDDLFLNILRHALPLQVGGCNDEKRRLRTVLGLLVCLREPMPILDMEAFCGLNSGDIMWPFTTCILSFRYLLVAVAGHLTSITAHSLTSLSTLPVVRTETLLWI